jgi:hypothetical protein
MKIEETLESTNITNEQEKALIKENFDEDDN